MLNEFKICQRCGCNSVHVTGIVGTSFDDVVVVDSVCSNCGHAFREQVPHAKESKQEKEKSTMQVTYKGFTGELVKLEKQQKPFAFGKYFYNISIYDSEKQVTYSFNDVNLCDVNFTIRLYVE